MSAEVRARRIAVQEQRLQTRSQACGNDLCFCADDNIVVPQISLPLRALAAQNMAAEGALMLDLASRGQFKPLLHAFVRLLLGHDSPSILSEVYEVDVS